MNGRPILHQAASSTVGADAYAARGQLIEEGRLEQIDTLYRQAPGNYLVSLVASTVVVAVLHGHVAPARLWGWYTAVLVLTVVRFALLYRYRRLAPSGVRIRAWGQGHIITSVAAGTLWGSAVLLLLVDESIVLQAFLFVVLAGMMAGAALSLNVYLPAYTAFILPIGVLVVGHMAALASFDSEHGRAMAGLAALLAGWVGITYYFARNANASYVRALRLDRENRKLDRTLASRVAEIESNNETLRAQVALRENAQADLKRANERLDLALSASQLAIWDWSQTRQAVYLDPSWAAMLGHPRDAQHRTVEELAALVHPEDLLRTRAAQIACLKGATEEYAIEHRVRAADGSWLWIMSRGRVVERDQAGRALRMIGTNLDISERKRAQEQIEDLNRALQSKLNQLAAANQELNDFASTVSHDLQAPLRRIDSFAALLQVRLGPTLDEEARRWLERVRRNSNRMSGLIEDLLVFARSARTDVARAQVDLNPIAKDVVDDLDEASDDRRIEWKIAPLPHAFVDPAMIRVILVNLIGNAIKYTRTRRIATIEIGADTTRADEIVIFVRDNGVGFDSRLREKIFNAFTRLHSDAEFEGTGIGLATVQRICERHGGRVWADSAEGQGAVFFVALPVKNK